MIDNFPKTIRIGPVVYDITEVNDLHDKGEELFGWVTYCDTTIRIDSASSVSRKKNVFIHELLHAMLFEAGYDEQDEEMVCRLGNVMTQVLTDNDFGFMREDE